MKARDIKVGEHYAIGSPTYPQRGEVLEVANFSRRVYSGEGCDFSGHLVTQLSAKVHYWAKDGKGPSGQRDEVVALTTIREPWAESRAVRLKREACALRDRLMEVAGVEVTIDPHCRAFTMDADDMRTLIEMAEKVARYDPTPKRRTTA